MLTAPTVLILIDSTTDLLGSLRSAGAGEIRIGPRLSGLNQSVPTELLRDVDCVLCDFLPANLDDMPRLRWVQLGSAGYSQIFGLGLVDRQIRVTNGLGNFDIPIAEWNIMMLLLWHRHLVELMEHQRQHVWDRSARFQAELRGSTVGFFGYGGLARETARLLQAMGVHVWALTRDGQVKRREHVYCVAGAGDPDGTLVERPFPMERKAEFLAGLDYLILAVPITPATTGIITEADLRCLKPAAVLLNPARAGLIDEAVLLRCLREGWIRGVSLDVHYAYPLPAEHPLWSLPNVVLTPHISGSGQSPHYLTRIYDIFAQNLTRFRQGEPLLNELKPAQIEGRS